MFVGNVQVYIKNRSLLIYYNKYLLARNDKLINNSVRYNNRTLTEKCKMSLRV